MGSSIACCWHWDGDQCQAIGPQGRSLVSPVGGQMHALRGLDSWDRRSWGLPRRVLSVSRQLQALFKRRLFAVPPAGYAF